MVSLIHAYGPPRTPLWSKASADLTGGLPVMAKHCGHTPLSNSQKLCSRPEWGSGRAISMNKADHGSELSTESIRVVDDRSGFGVNRGGEEGGL